MSTARSQGKDAGYRQNQLKTAMKFTNAISIDKRKGIPLADQNQVAGLKPGPGMTGVPPLQKLEAKTSLS